MSTMHVNLTLRVTLDGDGTSTADYVAASLVDQLTGIVRDELLTGNHAGGPWSWGLLGGPKWVVVDAELSPAVKA